MFTTSRERLRQHVASQHVTSEREDTAPSAPSLSQRTKTDKKQTCIYKDKPASFGCTPGLSWWCRLLNHMIPLWFHRHVVVLSITSVTFSVLFDLDQDQLDPIFDGIFLLTFLQHRTPTRHTHPPTESMQPVELNSCSHCFHDVLPTQLCNMHVSTLPVPWRIIKSGQMFHWSCGVRTDTLSLFYIFWYKRMATTLYMI